MNTKICLLFSLSIVLCSVQLRSQGTWGVQSSGVTVLIHCIKVVDQNVTWAAGESGTVIRTTNGGASWTSVGGGNIGQATIWNITAVDSSIAFVTTTPSSRTYIYRTSDGGSSWQQVFSQDGGFINDMHMFSPGSGIAYGDPVGGTWTILKTYDGGVTWSRMATEPTPKPSETGIYCNSLCVTDTLHVWFLGDHRVYRSSDGGITWSYSTTTDYFLSIWMNTNAVGMASTNVPNRGAVTNDSGNVWNATVSPGVGTPYALAGSGTKDFWYANSEAVYHTTDYGFSWSSENVIAGQLFAIDFVTLGTTVIGYVAGTGGSIARYVGTATSVHDDVRGVPSEFALEHNYPNPFNPSTTLRYELSVLSSVDLRVFDVLGREVAVLVNEEKTPGHYSVTWDADGMSSGIYFYQLRAGGNVFTKKMILLR
jgi:photosystem II stability/assembly factor-like uncharacterized protein